MNGADNTLPSAVAQVLDPDGTVAGAGFLVAEGLLATCAHVVQAAGGGPGTILHLAFPHLAGAPWVEGQVLGGEAWRAQEGEDVAFVRLATLPAGVPALPLGSAAGCRGHPVRSFGFPAQAPPDGHYGHGEAGGLLLATENRSSHLQLTNANDLTTGFSGAPVLDEVTGLVIGMITEITAPDRHQRGQGIAYVTPTQVLREILPELAEQEVCPYRGLESFTAEHARWFEGRRDAVRQVMTGLAGQRRLTLLLGPSGSGKSSLIQAGVLRALAVGELPGSDRWLPVIARPRHDLLAEIERAGLPGAAAGGIAAAVTRRLRAEDSYERVLLVVDQFEELLTEPAEGGGDRSAVAGQLQAAESTADLSVILIMRDDFYPQLAAQAPGLLQAAMPGLLNIPGTLSPEDLRDIITLPARDVGLHFQPGLPEQMLADVLATSPEGTTTRQAPATVLSMLELALNQLWQRRQDGYLTHEAYRRIGAVGGSLTTWCETALNQLPDGHRPIARRILTSLVRPADPVHRIPPTRAQVPLDELRDLAAGPEDDQAVDEVIAALTRHRIITTQRPAEPPGRPVAELIHDALIRDWGTLREWVSQDHRFHEWLDRAWARRASWAAKKDPGDLLAGTALAEGLDWSRQRGLPAGIRAFLTASKERQQALTRRSKRRTRVLAGLLALALIAVGGTVWQWRAAVEEREAARSRVLAATSSNLIYTNPELASLLAVQAYRTSPTPEAIESIRSAATLPLHRRMSGHTQGVSSVAFSRDGLTLATSSFDQTVRLWDAATGKTRTTLTGHTGQVNSVTFSRDGNTVATASSDGTARLWDATTGKARATLTGHTNAVFSVAFSPNSRTVATASTDGTARLWDATDGKTRTTLTGHTSQVLSVAFSPDGKALATAGFDQSVRLWDAASGKARATLTGHTNAVYSVAFSRDGKALATAGADGTARLWDAANGKTRTTLTGHTGQVTSARFSPDGKTLATAGVDHTVRLWDVATGATRTTLPGHTDTVLSVAFSPDGKTLASGSNDHMVRLWDVAAGSTRTTLTGHTNSVYSVAFSPDGRTLATASADRTARLWDLTTGKTLTTLAGHTEWVTSVRFSPDGKTLATASTDGTARLWDVTTGKIRNTQTWHTIGVAAVAFSPDGKTLATTSSGSTAQLWDVATGKARTTLTGHTEAVLSVAFSPDGHIVATAGLDGTARLWDVATGKIRTTLTGHTNQVLSVAFSPDSKTLATASTDFTVRLWDLQTGRTRTTLTGHKDLVSAVAFSPDGKSLATASHDLDARLWDMTTGRTRTILTRHSDAVSAVAFSPDGKTLATAGMDKTVQLYDVALPEPAAAIEKICRTVDRDLTPEERTAYLPGRSAGPVCG